jgi:nucleoside-diphosphate-sugar epimerase
VEAGDVRDTWADVSLAQAELAYAPRRALADGLRREYEWLRARS